MRSALIGIGGEAAEHGLHELGEETVAVVHEADAGELERHRAVDRRPDLRGDLDRVARPQLAALDASGVTQATSPLNARVAAWWDSSDGSKPATGFRNITV